MSEADKGVYDAMNKGISSANGKWLYFLGADDKLLDENVLSAVFSELISDKTKLIIGNIKYDLKGKGAIYTHNKSGLVISSWSRKIWFKNTLHHQAIFYNRIIFCNRNYSIKYSVLADYAFNLYLYKKKVEVKK